MIVVHATPNTQPGGIQGACLRDMYHSELTPGPVKYDPIPSAAKFKIPKIISLISIPIDFGWNKVMINYQ